MLVEFAIMVGAYQQLKKRVIQTGLKLALSWKKHKRHYGNFYRYYGKHSQKLHEMILQYLGNAGDEGAKRDSIYEYLKDVLPANKTEEQQLRYVGRLLVELNEEKQIDRIGLKWILKDYNRSV